MFIYNGSIVQTFLVVIVGFFLFALTFLVLTSGIWTRYYKLLISILSFIINKLLYQWSRVFIFFVVSKALDQSNLPGRDDLTNYGFTSLVRSFSILNF